MKLINRQIDRLGLTATMLAWSNFGSAGGIIGNMLTHGGGDPVWLWYIALNLGAGWLLTR